MRTLIRVVSICLLLVVVASAAGLLYAQQSSRQSSRTDGEPTQRVPRSPPSMTDLVESMRERLNPYQPERLQSLLMKPAVQVELEIDRGTPALIALALTDVRKKFSDAVSGANQLDNSDPEALRARMEEFKKLRAEIEQTTEVALNEIFPPKQYERLKQIALQIQIQDAGLSNVLLTGVLADEMQFPEGQLETISQKAEEYELEKQAKIRKLNEEYDSKLLGHLTPKQRKLFDQKMGEPFEYAPVSREAESFNQLRNILQRTLP